MTCGPLKLGIPSVMYNDCWIAAYLFIGMDIPLWLTMNITIDHPFSSVIFPFNADLKLFKGISHCHVWVIIRGILFLEAWQSAIIWWVVYWSTGHLPVISAWQDVRVWWQWPAEMDGADCSAGRLGRNCGVLCSFIVPSHFFEMM